MNNNFLFNKLTQIIKLLSIFIFLFLIFSCNNNKEAFLFYNHDYYYVYENEYRIYNSIKKKLNRNFFYVNELEIKSFDLLPDKLKEISNFKNNSIFYLNDFLTPLLLKNETFSSNNKFKLLTYNLPTIEINSGSFSIFNIIIDESTFKNRIINFTKHFSKKSDFSDCGLLSNTNYFFQYDLISDIKKNYKFDILEINKLDNEIISNWIDKNKFQVILLFGYEFNKSILNLHEDDYQNIIFIEFQTRYGELTNLIKYNIDINWKLTIDTALESKNFKKFINDDAKILTKYNYPVKNKKIVLIEKYKKITNKAK